MLPALVAGQFVIESAIAPSIRPSYERYKNGRSPEARSLLPTATPAQAVAATATAPAPTASPAPSVTPVVASAPVRLVIPDLKIDVPVVEMGWRVVQTADGPRSDWVIPKNQAGHHINSALLGDADNLVISGHNNIFGQVFKPIIEELMDGIPLTGQSITLLGSCAMSSIRLAYIVALAEKRGVNLDEVHGSVTEYPFCTTFGADRR